LRERGVTDAIKIDENAAQLKNFAQSRRILPTRHGGCEHRSSPVGQARASELEGGVLARMIEIVRIFITAGDGENARAQDTAERMVISKGLRGSAMTAASLAANPRRRSACPSNTTPASDVMRPPSKAAAIFLLSTAGNENRRKLSSVMAGVAWMRFCEGSAPATNP
jgi:hypothetical protein